MKLAQDHACPVVGLGITNVEPLCYVTRVRIFHTVEIVFSQRQQYNQDDSFLFHIIMMTMMICDSHIHFFKSEPFTFLVNNKENYVCGNLFFN
jgi:hypothetical protein